MSEDPQVVCPHCNGKGQRDRSFPANVGDFETCLTCLGLGAIEASFAEELLASEAEQRLLGTRSARAAAKRIAFAELYGKKKL
jgi:hypothetical protein